MPEEKSFTTKAMYRIYIQNHVVVPTNIKQTHGTSKTRNKRKKNIPFSLKSYAIVYIPKLGRADFKLISDLQFW